MYHKIIFRSQFVLFGFMNNILSGTKYRASPEGVSLMDETSNLLNQLAPKIQILHAICGLGYACIQQRRANNITELARA